MKKLILLLLLVPIFSFGQLKFTPSSNGVVVEHTYYSLSYLEEHEQAEWVHYKLNSTMLKGEIPRKKNYTIDRKVSTGSAKTSDYTNSGFDRGHLVPAADMKMDFASVKEAAYMSNISPQKPKFNQVVWKKLEEHARDLAKKSELYITTRGVLNSADLKK